jgi:hypothetical protein
MLSWMRETTSFAGTVTIANERTPRPSGECHSSQMPANANN